MAADWFYMKDGTRFGPIDAAKLKQFADSGVIRPDELVWKQGVKQWAKAASVRGLFEPQAFTADAGTTPQPETNEETAGIESGGYSGEAEQPIVVEARKRTFRKRKTFPALGFVAGLFVLVAALIMLCGVLGFIALMTQAAGATGEFGDPSTAGLVLGAFVAVLVAAAFAVIYLASAEVIRLALYAVTLLEDIRDEAAHIA